MAEAVEMQSATRSRRITRPPKRLYEDEGAPVVHEFCYASYVDGVIT